MRRAFHVGLALTALLSSGCVELEDFDPVGNDATIAGRWTIDGEPPSEASCETLGVEQVRVTFLDENRPVPHPALFFACTALQPGSDVPGTFDTRRAEGGAGPVVAGGDDEENPVATWRIRLDAIDGNGELIAFGPTAELDVPRDEETHLELPPANFLSGVLSAFFEIDGQAPTVERCDEAGIAEVRLEITGGGTVMDQAREPCATGAIGTRVEPGFAYTLRLQALDGAGTVVGASATETFMVEPGQQCVLGAGCDTDEMPAFDLTAL